MQKLNIIIAGEIFPPAIGGPAKYTELIAMSLYERGHDVRVLCYGEAGPHSKEYPFSIDRVSFSRIKVGHYIRYCIVLIKTIRAADLVYAQGPVASGLPGYILCWIFSKKLLVKVVGDYAWEQASNTGRTTQGVDEFQKTKQSGITRLHQYIERLTTRGSTAVIVPSEYLKRIVIGWGVDPDKVLVIYNAAPSLSKVRKPLQEIHTIVSYGRFVPWKGFDLLIELMPELVRKNPKFRLLVLGTGPLENALKRKVKELNMERYIKIAHMKPGERESILSEADMFVLNTGYEGLSHALLEAMAAGVPIITTQIGGNPELIRHNENGLLVPFNDAVALHQAIIRLHGDARLRAQFSHLGQDRAHTFSKERMLTETMTCIENL